MEEGHLHWNEQRLAFRLRRHIEISEQNTVFRRFFTGSNRNGLADGKKILALG